MKRLTVAFVLLALLLAALPTASADSKSVTASTSLYACSSAQRNNISLAVSSLSYITLEYGDSLSFNDRVGPREAVYGYLHPNKEPLGKRAWIGSTGASRILLEGKYLFDFIDTEADLEKYKLVILTDDTLLDGDYAEKLREFADNGGKILATGKSGLMTDGTGFALDLGAKYVGESKFDPSYIRPKFDMEGLYDSAYVIYQRAEEIEATGEVIAERQDPYFNRTVEHFSSHKHTPNDPTTSYPAATVGKDGAYIAFALFTEYATTGSLIAKRVVEGVIDRLLGDEKTLTTNLPSLGITTVMDQKGENRYVNHLAYAAPVKRGNGVEVIEDIVPLYNVEVSLKLDAEPKRVYLAPQMRDIDYDYTDGVITYTLDKLDCHQMIVIDY